MNCSNDDADALACPLETCAEERASRRGFLTSAGCFGMMLVLSSFPSGEASALPVLLTEGSADGDERRYPIPTADSVNVDRTAQLIVARSQGQVFVFALSCPHQNNAVKWLPKDHRFQCTKHDSQYQPDGVYTAGRSTRNLDRYVIRREGDSVVVDLHRWIQSDKDPAGWSTATIAV
jgi:nitrite reductase/ring-hydroxylating ferredoxin subunit